MKNQVLPNFGRQGDNAEGPSETCYSWRLYDTCARCVLAKLVAERWLSISCVAELLAPLLEEFSPVLELVLKKDGVAVEQPMRTTGWLQNNAEGKFCRLARRSVQFSAQTVPARSERCSFTL